MKDLNENPLEGVTVEMQSDSMTMWYANIIGPVIYHLLDHFLTKTILDWYPLWRRKVQGEHWFLRQLPIQVSKGKIIDSSGLFLNTKVRFCLRQKYSTPTSNKTLERSVSKLSRTIGCQLSTLSSSLKVWLLSSRTPTPIALWKLKSLNSSPRTMPHLLRRLRSSLRLMPNEKDNENLFLSK